MSMEFFEAFYQSSIQHPILLWIGNAAGTLFALRSLSGKEGRTHSGARAFVLIWALISALDAWLSANQVYGIGVLTNPWSSIIPFLFVWLGDFRVFLAMELLAVPPGGSIPDGKAMRRVIGRSIAACFVVPLLAGLLTQGQEARVLYLVYEILFIFWILHYGRWSGLSAYSAARGVRNLALFFYALWVLADLWILFAPIQARDFGFAIRVIPNVLYYGAFGWVFSRFFQRAPRRVSPKPLWQGLE